LEAIITAADPAIGVDIYLNGGDLGYGQGGDLSLVGNVTPSSNIWQAINLRIITVLGSYNWQNGYGTLLSQYVDEPITDDLQTQIELEVKKTILQDQRVAAITNLGIVSTTGTISISLSIVDTSGIASSGTIAVGNGNF
jgi:phage baseplate assembly protein W